MISGVVARVLTRLVICSSLSRLANFSHKFFFFFSFFHSLHQIHKTVRWFLTISIMDNIELLGTTIPGNIQHFKFVPPIK